MNKYINAAEIDYMYVSVGGHPEELMAYKEWIDKMPSADVVEVVRCKDCKYYTESKYFAPEKMCYRYKDNEGNKIGYIKSDNDFCSYGERGGETE